MTSSSLADELLTASRALVAVAVRSLDDGGAGHLPLAHYRALVVLAEQGPTATTALADAVGVHQSTISRAADRLVELGLVTRERDADDRRRSVVALAPKGRALIRAVLAARRKVIAGVADRMEHDDVEVVVAALRAFSEAAGTHELAGDWPL